MKDYYSSLHKFLSSHFPAQIHKLEAVRGNDVEVIKMYNMYKELAKDKLQERQESADTESKSQEVAKGIHTAINNVDESLHYEDFAKAVAITLKENYGTHNIAPFMKVLHAGLGINEVKVEDLNEAKATCCHRCGRVHVKGTPCKKPYLKGKKSCAINEIETLKEFYSK